MNDSELEAANAKLTAANSELTAANTTLTTAVATSEFTFANSSVTQVITLSAGILGLSVTFITSKTSSMSYSGSWLLKGSWIAFLVSLIAGVVSLSAITGLVNRKASSSNSGWLRVPWIIELVAFLVGLGMFAIFGFNNV